MFYFTEIQLAISKIHTESNVMILNYKSKSTEHVFVLQGANTQKDGASFYFL